MSLYMFYDDGVYVWGPILLSFYLFYYRLKFSWSVWVLHFFQAASMTQLF